MTGVGVHPRRPHREASTGGDPAERVVVDVFRIPVRVVGLLPTPEQLDEFLSDKSPDRRRRLVRRLLADRTQYAIHWMSFYNDMLRNDYRGTGSLARHAY